MRHESRQRTMPQLRSRRFARYASVNVAGCRFFDSSRLTIIYRCRRAAMLDTGHGATRLPPGRAMPRQPLSSAHAAAQTAAKRRYFFASTLPARVRAMLLLRQRPPMLRLRRLRRVTRGRDSAYGVVCRCCRFALLPRARY